MNPEPTPTSKPQCNYVQLGMVTALIVVTVGYVAAVLLKVPVTDLTPVLTLLVGALLKAPTQTQ